MGAGESAKTIVLGGMAKTEGSGCAGTIEAPGCASRPW
jgi:hypothetical protein